MQRPSVATGNHRMVRLPKERVRPAAFRAAAWFDVAVLSVIACGSLSLWISPGVDDSILDQKVPEDSFCFRVQRRATAAVVLMPSGSPSLVYKLGLRMDTSVDDVEDGVVITTGSMLESKSLSCNGTVCVDVVLIQTGGPSSIPTPQIAKFHYASSGTYLSSSLGVDGEMRLVNGRTYYLTSTHFCWKEKEGDEIKGGMEEAGSVYISKFEDAFFATRQNISHSSALADSPASTFSDKDGCEPQIFVALFPSEAVQERTFISLNSDKLYNYDSNALEQRRKVVEVGKGCESLDDKRAREIYESDCSLSSYFSCRTDPSLPFRRAADSKLKLQIGMDGTSAVLHAEKTVSLSQIPLLVHGSESVRIAIIRMAVLLITSAVVYIRSGQQISSPFHGFLHALKIASMDDHDQKFRRESGIVKVATDAAISLLALASRATVLGLAWRALLADNYSRVVVSELVGCFVSFAHLLLRYACLKFDLKKEPPLSMDILGGDVLLRRLTIFFACVL